MLLFPNAKINLGLNVVEKRPDLYHNLETVFYPIGLTDVLEFVPDPGMASRQASMNLTGLDLDGSPGDNLCVKAYRLLCRDFNLPGISIHLHKIIPAGAGLGGGSADAGFMLKGLNRQFGLGLEEAQLEAYAAELGSDCAFFIRNRPVFAFERGQVFRESALNLDAFFILLVYPSLHISTSEAYSGIIPAKPEKSPEHLVHLPVNAWKNTLINDFEAGLFAAYPILPAIKEILYATGALYASLSGSGSSVFGIYSWFPDVPEEFSGYFTWRGKMPGIVKSE